MTNPIKAQQPELWPCHGHDAAAAVAILGKTLLDMVGIAAGLSKGGRQVDVTGLDHAVGLLCAKALDLQPDEGHSARVGLYTLLTQIDALSLALRT